MTRTSNQTVDKINQTIHNLYGHEGITGFVDVQVEFHCLLNKLFLPLKLSCRQTFWLSDVREQKSENTSESEIRKSLRQIRIFISAIFKVLQSVKLFRAVFYSTWTSFTCKSFACGNSLRGSLRVKKQSSGVTLGINYLSATKSIRDSETFVDYFLAEKGKVSSQIISPAGKNLKADQ